MGSMEVWTSSTLESERRCLREQYGESQPAQIDVGLKVGGLGGGQSHVVLLHPQPLTRKHLLLVPNRHVREVASEESGGEVTHLEVPQHNFRVAVDDDLSYEDFLVAMEVLGNIGGVATWTGLRNA